MALFSQIQAVAGYLPPAVLDNSELAVTTGWTEEEILAKTGIRRRHIAAEGECTSELAIAAIRRLLEKAQVAGETIEFLILCTQTPDYILPTTACVVQAAVGLPTTCAAFDINLGCSGYIYALGMADSFVRSGMFRQGLVVTADTYTRYVHPQDRSTRTIFGDGAAATLVGGSDTPGLGAFVFGTDGRGASNLIIPAGGTRLPRGEATREAVADASGNWRSPENIAMNGPEIFTFTLQRVPAVIRQLLEKAALTINQIDKLVFHQANQYMLEHLRKKLGLPPERLLGRLKEVGNTVSSSIPLVLEEMLDSGTIQPGEQVMLVGFGVGYSWGAALWKP